MKSTGNSWSRNSDSSLFCMILNELCFKVCRCENCHPADLWIRRGHLPIRTIDELMGFKHQASWNTFHGRNFAQLIWRIYHYLQGFYLSQVVQDFFHQQYLQIIPSFQSLDFQPHEAFMLHPFVAPSVGGIDTPFGHRRRWGVPGCFFRLMGWQVSTIIGAPRSSFSPIRCLCRLASEERWVKSQLVQHLLASFCLKHFQCRTVERVFWSQVFPCTLNSQEARWLGVLNTYFLQGVSANNANTSQRIRHHGGIRCMREWKHLKIFHKLHDTW